jgi:hypothetical protein
MNTNQNQPIDDLSPIEQERTTEEAIAQLKSLRMSMQLNGLSIQALRAEGRS